jgi:FkbM family methyltransferase
MFRPYQLNSISDHPDFTSTSVADTLSKQPLGFIDVGARGGTHDMVYAIARQTAVLGFEPDINECNRLLGIERVVSPWANFQLESLALAEVTQEVSLHLLSEPNNHSLLPPNADFARRYNMVKWQQVGTTLLNAVSLDSVLFGSRVEENYWGEFIKLDTQGTEFEILKGATQTLNQRCVAIVAEVSFCELYKGQKLFSNVEQLLRDHGFSFYGFMPIHTRSRKLLDKHTHITVERALYADAIFFKDPLAGGNCSEIDLTIRQQQVLFTVAILLNFYDFALELACGTWLRNANDSERTSIDRLVKSLAELPITQSIQAVEDLQKQVKLRPELANLSVGNFVDRRRRICDFDDILNISPLPRTF